MVVTNDVPLRSLCEWISQSEWKKKYPHDCPWGKPDPCEYAGGYRYFTPREAFLDTLASIQANAEPEDPAAKENNPLHEAIDHGEFRLLFEEMKRRYDEDPDQDLRSLYLEAKFRNRYLNYWLISQFPRDAKYLNGVSLEMMGTTPAFCRDWCRDFPEYAPKKVV